MSSATHLPRCSDCLATNKRQRRGSLLLAILVALTTASMPATADESHDRFVGPPSRLQPRLSNETGTPRVTAVPDDWELLNQPTRIAKREFERPAVGDNRGITTTAHINPFAVDQAPTDPVAVAPPGAVLFVAQASPDAVPDTVDEQQTPPDLPLRFQAEPDLQADPEPIATGQTLPCFVARPMAEITTNIALPQGALPANIAFDCVGTTGVVHDVRMQFGWAQFDFHWAPTCLCHGPLYFEDVNAERYGYTACRLLQPAISGAKFFLTIPALPYKMAVDPPHECVYTLGHYRPGSCAPWRWNHLPLHVGAAIVEVGTIAGLILLLP